MESKQVIRPLTKAKLADLVNLDSLCFQVPWSKREIQEELEHHQSLGLGFWSEESLVGALFARVIIDEIWIFRILVHPDHRRLKVAHSLFSKIIKPFTLGNEKTIGSVWIEVAKSNIGAIRFYESENFLKVSSRIGYYAANHLRSEPEDAWVMCRKL